MSDTDLLREAKGEVNVLAHLLGLCASALTEVLPCAYWNCDVEYAAYSDLAMQCERVALQIRLKYQSEVAQ
jgi:hypothetical protein